MESVATSLPEDIYKCIIDRLTWKAVGVLSCTCKFFQKLNIYPSRLCITTDIGRWSRINIDTQWVWLLKRIEKVKVVTIESESSLSNVSGTRYGHAFDLPARDWSQKTDASQPIRDANLEAFGAALKHVVHLNLNPIDSGEATKVFQALPSSSVLRHLSVPINETSAAANIHTRFPNVQFIEFGWPENLGYRIVPTEVLELPNLVELRSFSLLCPPHLSSCKKLKILTTYIDSATQKIRALPASLEELNMSTKSVMTLIELPSGAKGLQKLRIEAKHSAEYSSIPASPLRTLPDSWKDLEHLEDLSITCAGLDEPSLFQVLQNPSSMKSINVRMNFFKIAPNFERFSKIEEINMSSNLLEQFPGVFELSSLKSLKLGLNKISELPSSFGAAADSLEYLDLSENPFVVNAEFWSSLMTLRNLKTLILDEITLGTIPADFFNAFQKLKALHLMGCLINSLPESVGLCQQLQIVDLSYNRLDTLPKQFADLPYLTHVNLRFNPLESFSLRLPAAVVPCSTSAMIDILRQEIQGSPYNGTVEALHNEYNRYVVDALPHLPPQIQLAADYTESSEKREGAWFFLNPEHRSIIGHGDSGRAKSKKANKPSLYSNLSLHYAIAAEAVYRTEWKKYASTWSRGADIEGSGGWGKPMYARDRVSMSGFCRSGSFGGLAIGEVGFDSAGQLEIKFEMRLAGTAWRYQWWNSRGHWMTYSATLNLDPNTLKMNQLKRGPSVDSYREPK